MHYTLSVPSGSHLTINAQWTATDPRSFAYHSVCPSDRLVIAIAKRIAMKWQMDGWWWRLRCWCLRSLNALIAIEYLPPLKSSVKYLLKFHRNVKCKKYKHLVNIFECWQIFAFMTKREEDKRQCDQPCDGIHHPFILKEIKSDILDWI